MGTDLVRVRHRCRVNLRYVHVVQPALFLGGGYGGTQRSTYEHCPKCLSTRLVSVTTERPDRN